MEALLIIGVLLVVVSLLGFGGVLGGLRRVAWLTLVIAILLIGLAFVF
jgi:hypothetical protein